MHFHAQNFSFEKLCSSPWISNYRHYFSTLFPGTAHLDRPIYSSDCHVPRVLCNRSLGVESPTLAHMSEQTGLNHLFREWDAGRLSNSELEEGIGALGLEVCDGLREAIYSSSLTRNLCFADFMRHLRSARRTGLRTHIMLPSPDVSHTLMSAMLRMERVSSSVKAPFGTDFTGGEYIPVIRRARAIVEDHHKENL
jgi:hypothetical protein